jgi:hypothetical protein
MSHPTSRRPSTPIAGRRVFADDEGRLWNATFSGSGGGAAEFSCIGDGRRSVRAIAFDPTLTVAAFVELLASAC